VNGAVNKVSKKENEGTAAGAEEAEISLDI